MNYSTAMKWITAIAEGFLAIPIIGGALVIGTGYSALGVMFILHAITLILSIRDRQGKGSIYSGPRDERCECYPAYRLVHASTYCRRPVLFGTDVTTQSVMIKQNALPRKAERAFS